jgi:hypothetical protein
VAELCPTRPLCRSIQRPGSTDLQATGLGVMFRTDFFLSMKSLFHPVRQKSHPVGQKSHGLRKWSHRVSFFLRHIILQGKAKPSSSL